MLNRWCAGSVVPGVTPPRRPGRHVLLAAALLGAAACGTSAPSTPATPAGAPFTIQGYRFGDLVAAPGATITFSDGDDEPHTVTADDGSFDTGSFDSSEPGSLVAPATPGDYPVHCAIHPSMHGTLTVR